MHLADCGLLGREKKQGRDHCQYRIINIKSFTAMSNSGVVPMGEPMAGSTSPSWMGSTFNLLNVQSVRAEVCNKTKQPPGEELHMLTSSEFLG